MVSHTNKVGRREREAQTTQNQSAEEKWYSGSWKIRHLHRNRLVTSTGCSTFGRLRPRRNASCANCCSQSYQTMRRRWLIVVGVYEEEAWSHAQKTETVNTNQLVNNNNSKPHTWNINFTVQPRNHRLTTTGCRKWIMGNVSAQLAIYWSEPRRLEFGNARDPLQEDVLNNHIIPTGSTTFMPCVCPSKLSPLGFSPPDPSHHTHLASVQLHSQLASCHQ